MKAKNRKRTLGALVLTFSLLSGVTVLSVTIVRAQGRRGGDSGSRGSSGGSSRSSGSSGNSSGGSRSANSSSGQSRSSSGQSRSSGNQSRGSDQRRSGGDRSVRPSRDRSGDNASSGSGNGSRSGNPGMRDRDGWRDRGGDKDRGRDRDKDRDRDRDHHRHRGRDRDRRHSLERERYLYRTRVYQSSNYGGYRYSSNAYEQGYQDGLYTGANDGRRGQGYDPERSHFYKHGASGFLSIFGSPSSYSLAYRDGFLRGYDEGYQHYETYFSGGRFHR